MSGLYHKLISNFPRSHRNIMYTETAMALFLFDLSSWGYFFFRWTFFLDGVEFSFLDTYK